ncbi:MAG: beta-lactamase family protein [Acidobacteriota bacterium]|nr:beta-lactamase family protein [Acidobacteriota bacterium]
MQIKRRLFVIFLGLLLPAAALAPALPRASRPEDVGISSERLERIRVQMKSDVENRRIPGAVLLIARAGKIAALETLGFHDRAKQAPMRADSIFRVASMSKPITSVAAMILAEEGKLDIGAPVAQYLPEFKDVKVGIEKIAPKRPMTVQDLMRHTSGLTYGIFGNSPVDELYKKSNVFVGKSLADMVAKIASLPLLHQPGEVWEYSVSTDVLGRVIEVASGMDLDRFVAERITRPLKMSDTGFYLNASQAQRLARPDSAMMMPPGDPTAKPAVFSGGGGMLSTAGDYARFCQMLLNGGELEGVRILSPKTVALMTSDQLPPSTERHSPVAMGLNAFGPTPEMGTSFGLGFAVRTSAGRNPVPGSVGDFSWAGITGTYFWVDPKEKLIAVLMMQVPQATNVPYWRQTRTLVYQALVN